VRLEWGLFIEIQVFWTLDKEKEKITEYKRKTSRLAMSSNLMKVTSRLAMSSENNQFEKVLFSDDIARRDVFLFRVPQSNTPFQGPTIKKFIQRPHSHTRPYK
jgi:hypothetical protein